MCFSVLPIELLSVILNHVAPDTIVQFACINKMCFALSLKRLEIHRQLLKQYHTLRDDYDSWDSNTLFLKNIGAILDDPQLISSYVHDIHLGESEDVIAVFDGESDTTKAETRKLKSSLYRKGLMFAGRNNLVPVLGHNMEPLRRRTADGSFQDVTQIIAMLLPTFTNLRSLRLEVISGPHGYGEGVRSVSSIIWHHVTMLHSRSWLYPRAYGCLKTLEIRINDAYDNYFTLNDLILFLALPALVNLICSGLICESSHDSSPPIPLEQIKAAGVSPALEELTLTVCSVEPDTTSLFFGMMRPNTLQKVNIGTESRCDGTLMPLHTPKTFVELLRGLTSDSLRQIKLSASEHHIDEDLFAHLGEQKPEACMDQMDFTRWGFDANTNLCDFSALRVVEVDAELLLNGYGIIERVQFFPWCERFQDQCLGKPVPAPTDGPPLAALLPASLEMLHVHGTALQKRVFEERVGQMTANLASERRLEGFLSLREIRFSLREEETWKVLWHHADSESCA